MDRNQTEHNLPREEHTVSDNHKLNLDELKLVIYNILYYIAWLQLFQ